MHEAAGGIEFETNVFSSAQAGVDREDDVQRQLGFAIENSDVLWLTVSATVKSSFARPATGAPRLLTTVANTLTSFTFDLNVAVGSWKCYLRRMVPGHS